MRQNTNQIGNMRQTKQSRFAVKASAVVLGVNLAIGVLSPGSVLAATFVQWGGDYVSQSQVLSNTAYPSDYYVTSESGQSYGSLKGSIQSLAPTSGYAAPSGATSGFSGGWMGSQGAGPGFPGDASGNEGALNNRVVYENGANDRISLSLLAAGAPAMRGLIVFDKGGFLNGLNSGPVSFDSSSQLSFSGIMDGYRPIGRWLVQDGGVWYISQSEIVQNAYNTVETHVLGDLNNALWSVYQPVITDSYGTYFFNAAPSTGYAAHAFSDVTSVGVFFDSYGQANTDGGFSRFVLQEFSATAVPEPSVLALIGAGALLVGVRQWKRRRG